MAEGAPLLREYGVKLIEGSNPSLSAICLSFFRYAALHRGAHSVTHFMCAPSFACGAPCLTKKIRRKCLLQSFAFPSRYESKLYNLLFYIIQFTDYKLYNLHVKKSRENDGKSQ